MKSKKFMFVVVVLAIAAGAIYFLHGNGKPDIRNVLLISMDTTRADYLGCYGYRRKTTPFIDSLAAEGVLFENAFSHIPLTLPAHSSMLTGTIPPYHGVHDNVEYRLGESNITLAEILRDNGFKTAAVISSFVIDSQFGLDQGFDHYNDEFVEDIQTRNFFAQRRGQETTDFTNKWLEENGREPFFMFTHYYDPHATYDAPEPFGSKFMRFDIGVDKIKNKYAGEIAYTDHCIKQIIDKLKELDLYDSTLIVITGDHGEMFGEHKEQSHGYFVYRNVIRVPLIFKVPGKDKAIRVRDNCGLMDIVPTICDLLGIEAPEAVQGKSLRSYFKSGETSGEKRSIFAESLTPTTFSANSLLSVINDKWQYIQTTRPELYDLVADPYELADLITEEPQRVRILQDSLREILESSVNIGGSDTRFGIDEEARKKLESLGYIQGGTSIDESFDFDQGKPDPKDYIEIFNKKLKVNELVLDEKYEEATEICLKMIEEYPDIAFMYHSLGDIAIRQEKFAEAEKYRRKAQELDPDNYKGYSMLGIVLAKQERYEEAVVQYEKALAIKPDDLDSNREMGIALAHLKDYANAVKYLKTALEIAPDDLDSNREMGIALAHLKDYANAVKYLKTALEIAPENAMLNAAFAEALFYLDDIDNAINFWEISLEIDPKDEKVQQQLAEAKEIKQKVDKAAEQNKIAESYFAKGDIAKAVENWKKTLEINDKWPGVLNNLAWILATSKDKNIRNPQEAVEYGKKACELTGYKNAELLDSLAAGYAAAGDLDKAIETAEKAIDVAVSLGLDQNAEQSRGHLSMYRIGKAIYE